MVKDTFHFISPDKSSGGLHRIIQAILWPNHERFRSC